METECQKVERQVSNTKQVFRKIKKIAGKLSTPASKCINAANNTILQDSKDVAQRWNEYLQELFHDEHEQKGTKR